MRQIIFLTTVLMLMQSLTQSSAKASLETKTKSSLHDGVTQQASIRQKILQRRLLMSLQPMRMYVAEHRLGVHPALAI